jgi:phospholipase C
MAVVGHRSSTCHAREKATVSVRRPRRATIAAASVATLAAAGLVAATFVSSSAAPPKSPLAAANAPKSGATVLVDRSNKTTTPIKHIVVLFDENNSYDHYFGTYPKAANTDGTPFHAAKGTPTNNNLITSGNLKKNPNQYKPTRLTPAEALTCDQNHSYGPEQLAADGGKMDKFVQNLSVDTCSGGYGAPGLTMDYFDGNTVTALWNYAQHYALSDNSYDTDYGPSTPGALNLISGNTHGFREVDSVTGKQVPTPGTYTLVAPDKNGVGTVVNDPDPAFDDCADANHTSTNTLAAADGKNIGNLLNKRKVSWGWFQGGFTPTVKASKTTKYAVCGTKHNNVGKASVTDYSPHHNPFAYYKSTSNPHHLPPKNLAEVGHSGQANHQYDLTWFDQAAAAGKLPAVSFVKQAEYQDGHAGYSDPIDEQHGLVHEINTIERSPEWSSTAIVIAYDDSDGWYDHAFASVTNGSKTSLDSAMCSSKKALDNEQGRCGPGPRLPLLVISPYARTNFIDHHFTKQVSILKFIEDNWSTSQIGAGSLDASARTLTHMFNFKQPTKQRVILNKDGSVKAIKTYH